MPGSPGEPANAPEAPVAPEAPGVPAATGATGTSAAPAALTPAERAARRRRRLEIALLLTPYGLAVATGYVAAALTPTLLQEHGGHPLVLIALDARNRNLVLASGAVAAVPYFTVACLRLLAVDPFMFVIGRRYGDAGIRWVERRFASARPTIDLFERMFKAAAPLAVAAFPGPLICTLAGATGMSVAGFLVFNIAGTLIRVWLFWWLGDIFSGPVDVIRRFFDRYLVWTTVVSVLLVVVWIWSERRAGKAEAETPGELADQLEAEVERSEEQR